MSTVSSPYKLTTKFQLTNVSGNEEEEGVSISGSDSWGVLTAPTINQLFKYIGRSIGICCQ